MDCFEYPELALVKNFQYENGVPVKRLKEFRASFLA